MLRLLRKHAVRKNITIIEIFHLYLFAVRMNRACRCAFTSSILTASFTSLFHTRPDIYLYSLHSFSQPAFQASACAPRVRRVLIRLMQSDGVILTTSLHTQMTW
jgi:hypothetical protein